MSKILITSCDTSPVGGRAQAHKMLELYELSDRMHFVTNDPVSADYILICDATWENYGFKIRKNKLLREYPNKSFILSNLANPYYYARGILTNAEKSVSLSKRFRSCSYTAYYDPYHNPFIAKHDSYCKVEQKDYLFSFVGRNCHPVRDIIFQLSFTREDILVRDTTELFDLWNGSAVNVKLQEEYYKIMLKSKFVLCPRGVGANSIRLFEAMKLGLPLVIISDDFMLPAGPNWEDFSIIVKEKNVDKIESILISYEDRFYEMGRLAKTNYDKFFSENNYFNYVVKNIEEIAHNQLIPEVYYHKLNDLVILGKKIINFKPNKWCLLKKTFK